MEITLVTHVALRVSSVREAENYYSKLFGLDVAWREAQIGNSWRTLPEGKTWDDAEAAGIVLSPVFLWRDGFGLALERADVLQPEGQLSHIGILVDQEMFEMLRQRAANMDCKIHVDSGVTMVFDDKYGIRWEPTTHSYDDPKSQSSGASGGRWIEL